MGCDGCCGYAGFPPLAGEMSEGQRGREDCIPPLFAEQKGDAASAARRRGFIHPHPSQPIIVQASPQTPLRSAKGGDSSLRLERQRDSQTPKSQPIIKNHRNHSSKDGMTPCVSLRWHPLQFPLREGEGKNFADVKRRGGSRTAPTVILWVWRLKTWNAFRIWKVRMSTWLRRLN